AGRLRSVEPETNRRQTGLDAARRSTTIVTLTSRRVGGSGAPAPLAARRSLLAARCSLLAARRSPLAARGALGARRRDGCGIAFARVHAHASFDTVQSRLHSFFSARSTADSGNP
ncbi:hypothetical protein ACEPUC_31900, partial [Burkholderia pseudomallei]